MINLEWYRTFKAVYQNGTLTKAANELMISQPNVSIQLSSLETYIGHLLFTRHPRKMEPTEYGKRLYTQIIEPLDNLEKVEAEFKRSTLNKLPVIRFGTPPEIFQTYLAGNLRHLDANINIKFGNASALEESLLNNELDVAIITKQSKADDKLHYEPIVNETLKIICAPHFDTIPFVNLPHTEKLADTEKWLKEQSWYAYDNSLPMIRRFWRENFAKRPIIKIKAVIPDHNALIEAVANSNSLTISSDLIAGKALRSGTIKTLWDGVKLSTNTLYIAYNKSKVTQAIVEDMKNYIKLSLHL